MASQTIRSSSVTFLDTTDDRKIEVYIASNLPTTQIFNINNDTYTPDWSSTNLTLSANVFLDSKEVTTDSQTSIVWYKKINSDTLETEAGTGASITISTNEMIDGIDMLTYICKATYQGIASRQQITFPKVLTGADGTGINPKGTATTVTAVDGTDYYTVEYKGSVVTTAEPGDAYLYNGDLYMCSESRDGADYFVNAGHIQGEPGQDAKSIILNADAQVFKVAQDGTISPSSIVVTAQAINTTIPTDGWTYSVDGGTTFVSTAPDGVVRNENTVTITGINIPSNMVIIKASNGIYSDTYTVYKAFDGADGAPGDGGESAPIAFLTNENITFSADAQGQINATSVTSNIVAYDGITKVLPAIEEVTGMPEGMSIVTETVSESNEIMLTITIDDKATLGSVLSNSGSISVPITSPISTVLSLNWSKINTGLNGEKGIDAVVFQIYSENGYVLSQDTPSITLKTFAYNGDVPIEGGAVYQWYQIIDGAQTKISTYVLASTYNADEKYYSDMNGTAADPQPTSEEEVQNGTYYVYANDATNSYLNIAHTDVSFSCSYMCKMTFNENEYISVVTIDDKNDTNTIFTSKPSSYMAGDLWVVGEDYAPSGIEVGTVLRSEHTNNTYNEEDWVLATKYDEQLRILQDNIDTYNQYFSFNQQDGLVISARDEAGNQSKVSTALSNTQLSFNYEDEAIAYISSSKMHIKEAEIESPLTVTGQYSGSTMLQAPTINLGGFSLVVESNGSLSIASNL